MEAYLNIWMYQWTVTTGHFPREVQTCWGKRPQTAPAATADLSPQKSPNH